MKRVMYVDFYVQGSERFPIDMLRVDKCFPTDKQAAERIAWSPHVDSMALETMMIKLTHIVNDGQRWAPSVKKWDALGWPVMKAFNKSIEDGR